MRTLAAFLIFLSVCFTASRAAAAPSVVATVLPIHALAADLMAGVSQPTLLISPGTSPHDFSLKPSDLRNLRSAGLVIRVGKALEPGIDRSVQTLPTHKILTLTNIQNLTRHVERRSAKQIRSVEGGAMDPHIWLDPQNGALIARAITLKLKEIDPAHQSQYDANLVKVLADIEALELTLTRIFSAVAQQPFFTFHDAYQYLEARYHLNNRGFVVAHAEHPTVGARHIRDLRDIAQKEQVTCIFTEPEFEPALINPLLEGTNMRPVQLDHLGATFFQSASKQGLYGRMMTKLGHDLASCLMDNRKSS